MTNKHTNVIAFFAIAVLLFTFLFFSFCVGGGNTTYAATIQEEKFDETNVADDLEGTTIDGKAFDLKDYGFDSTKSVEVLNFVEYCYAKDSKSRGNFGLYVYVYNPVNTAFDVDSNLNKIQFKIGDEPTYAKYYLQYLNSYQNKLFKYKVVLTSAKKIELLNKLNADERVYTVSGIELLTDKATNATEYYVATQYTYTGYSAGYGSDTSTLRCTAKETDVVTLDVQQTYYRYPKTTTSLLQTSVISTQLNSVYFSLDSKYIKKYDKLYRIWAEYYQYELAPIVVTENDDVYDFMQNAPADLSTANIETPYIMFGYISSSVDSSEHYATWGYGKGTSYSAFGRTIRKSSDYVDYTKKLLSFKSDDPRNAVISRDDLETEMYRVAKSTGAADGKLNDYVVTGGNGYTQIDITADDLFDLNGFNAGSDIANWWHGLFGYNNSDIDDIEPIYEVTAKDLTGEDKDISNNLLIAQSDVAAFKTYCKTEMAKGNTVYIFRYSTSEYQEMPVYVRPTGVTWVFSELDNQSLRFETIDKDFDIIQLGFGNAEKLVIIPVVSNPVDIIATSDGIVKNPFADDGGIPWWVWLIVAVVALILICTLLPNVIVWIVKAIVAIVMGIIKFPFKLAHKIKERREKE